MSHQAEQFFNVTVQRTPSDAKRSFLLIICEEILEVTLFLISLCPFAFLPPLR